MEMTLPPELSEWIRARFTSRAAFWRPLAGLCTLGVGGPAEVLVRAGEEGELRELLERAADAGVPVTVLGRGSNVLIADRGIPGIVLRLCGSFFRIRIEEEAADSARISAGAAAPLPGLCLFAARRGFAGLGFTAGIPGSVGGALLGNAGAHGSCMSEVITGFYIARPGGPSSFVQKDALSWRYRGFEPNPAVFGEKGRPSVITRADFLLPRGNAEELLAERKELIARRRATQPVREKSAGCFFKNPPEGPSAGLLIDRAGLKGLRVGGALISPAHANYFINTGSATAADFLALMERATEEVSRRFGTLLEPEVKVLA